MNLPNKLTLTRIILVPVFMVFVSLTQIGTEDFNPTWYLVAGIVFAAASFTDFLDGHLARKWNMVTDFGKFADPLADKLLTTVAFIYMLRDGVCSPVVLCIILAREFAVSGLRMVAAGAKDGKVIAANMWGKVKTVLQMLTVLFYYFAAALAGPTDAMAVGLITQILCWLCGVATVLSGGFTCGRTASCSCRRSNSRRAVGAGHARPAALPYMPFYIRCRAGHVRPLQGNGPQ